METVVKLCSLPAEIVLAYHQDGLVGETGVYNTIYTDEHNISFGPWYKVVVVTGVNRFPRPWPPVARPAARAGITEMTYGVDWSWAEWPPPLPRTAASRG